MAIKTRAELEAWFLPSFKLITDRISSFFDSFLNLSDDVFISENLIDSEQQVNYSILVDHNLHAQEILVQLEDDEGNTPVNVNMVINYVVDDEVKVTDSVSVEFSDTIPEGKYYKIKVIKIK